MQLVPGHAEARGLLALMLLTDARRPARLDRNADLEPLEGQDRSLWDRAAMAAGIALIDRALAAGEPGPYQVQAAIAALHVGAASAADTDWPQIAALYRALLRWTPMPVVELNAAVALGMAEDLEAALAWMDRLDAAGPNWEKRFVARA